MRQLSRELLPAAPRRENQELKTDAPSGHGLAAAFGVIPYGGNDGLPRDVCAAERTPNLRPRPSGGGTADHSDARIPGQHAPLRPAAPSPFAAAPSRHI